MAQEIVISFPLGALQWEIEREKMRECRAETDRKLVCGSERLDVNTVGGGRRQRTARDQRRKFPFPILF